MSKEDINLDINLDDLDNEEEVEVEYTPRTRRGNGREPIKITTAVKDVFKVNNPTLKLYDFVIECERHQDVERFFEALVEFKERYPDKYNQLIGNKIDLDGLDEYSDSEE